MKTKVQKTALETIFCLVIILSAIFVASETGYAVEASPDSPYKGKAAECCSQTGEPLDIKDIPRRLNNEGQIIMKNPKSSGGETRAIPLVAIVIGFSNVSYNDEYDWSDSLFDGEKSVAEYYRDMSFGQFTFIPAEEESAYGNAGNTNAPDEANDGIIHIELDTPHKDWSSVDILNSGAYQSYRDVQGLALKEAAKYMDFDKYDVNDNSSLDQEEIAVAFIVAGYEGSKWSGEHTYGKEKYLWAHAGWSGAQITSKTWLSNQISIAENLAEKKGIVEQAPNNVLVHELGHYLGFPDLYMLPGVITEGTPAAWHPYDVGYLSIMSSTWTEDEEGRYMPYSLDPWCRIKAGWVEPQTASADGEYQVVSQDYSDQSKKYKILRINTQYENEYFLVENRQKNKWDSGLERAYYNDDMKNGGIVIWHIEDLTYSDYFPNQYGHAPAVMPLYPEVYGDSSKDSGADRTFIGDDVATGEPFFSKSIWESRYRENIGNSLILPIYAIPSEANGGKNIEEIQPEDRVYSNIDVEFVSDNGNEMSIKVSRGSCTHERAITKKRIGEEDCNAPAEYESSSRCTKCGRDLGKWVESHYPKGHEWIFDHFIWHGNEEQGYQNAEAVYRCKNEAKHTFSGNEPDKIQAEVTKEVVKPTYEKGGYTIYRAFVPEELSSDGKEHAETKKAEFTRKLKKKPNTLFAKGKTVKIRYEKLKKKNQFIKRAKAITVKKAIGKVTYRKAGGTSKAAGKKIRINKKTGNITVNKGLRKGTYKIRVTVTAAGGSTYDKGTKTVTIRVKVL